MSKVLVISDSHLGLGNLEKIFKKEADADEVLCLGDGIEGLRRCLQRLPEFRQKEIRMVRGNCDSMCAEPSKRKILIDGHWIFCTHGHVDGVKGSLYELSRHTAIEGCEAALYGHTHQPKLTKEQGITLFNPGTAAKGQYGIITTEPDSGEIRFEHRTL